MGGVDLERGLEMTDRSLFLTINAEQGIAETKKGRRATPLLLVSIHRRGFIGPVRRPGNHRPETANS
jgi:hypothetical protein